ncbi:phage polarity suppression protein [Escherichia coli]|uniref:phage polarity suppression protein n=1 Tax=Escherichia coli TaxID=562 RepID=UPI000E201EA6|nr:phage polarity suppression protein [Escherichia coli]EFB3995834.1 phage polarity suppression protein [Escherichia coli]EFI3091549.1 phage polarity suppression protein [Escherichia coli]MBZ9477132.1 phage polarity suppression protein [Escherichia coli]MBZ9481777.1 phage polarity suppression protein [Escherichia coli]MBZ9486435.1 phage polarity suppression protein [Escherichia coli]
MTARGTPDQALTSFRNARILWAGHSESRKAVEQQIASLLAATEKPADYARQLELLRERLDVLKWQIYCAARECIYAQHLLMEACTEAALSNFMQANGAALTSALAPFLKRRGGVDVASRILRSALVRQLAITPPEIAGDYRGILDESGLMPDPGMIRDCQGSYTPAQHLRFQQRLNDINDIQE